METTLDSPVGVNPRTEAMSVKDWMITILIAAIPLIGFIMLFVWGFGSDTNVNKANWAKATLIWMAIFVGLYILIAVIFGAAILSGVGSYN